jgi:hypothetical protein
MTTIKINLKRMMILGLLYLKDIQNAMAAIKPNVFGGTVPMPNRNTSSPMSGLENSSEITESLITIKVTVKNHISSILHRSSSLFELSTSAAVNRLVPVNSTQYPKTNFGRGLKIDERPATAI